MTTKTDDTKRFKIQQLERQLEAVARMVRAYPANPSYTRKLRYIQTKLTQVRAK